MELKDKSVRRSNSSFKKNDALAGKTEQKKRSQETRSQIVKIKSIGWSFDMVITRNDHPARHSSSFLLRFYYYHYFIGHKRNLVFVPSSQDPFAYVSIPEDYDVHILWSRWIGSNYRQGVI